MVRQRIGDRSYRVQIKETVIQDVHQDHLKTVQDSLVTEPRYELYHYQGIHQDYDTAPDEYIVDKVVGHRWKKDGTLEFRVHWKGFDTNEDTWEPPSTFLLKYNTDFVHYCREKRLCDKVDLFCYLQDEPNTEDQTTPLGA